MSASVFDSPLHAQLFPTGDTGRLFSDTASVRAMLLVEGALAKVQGQAGIIPEVSGAAIHRATLEIQVDPAGLAASTGQNGVCVPGLVAAFRTQMNAPEHAQYLHWGATSQDIIDTGLMLRLRQALALAEADMRTLLTALADQAEAHAETPMPARTYGQQATPTTWGAVIANWGAPLLDALGALPALRANSLWVSLSGAAGTASVLGNDPVQLRRALAEALGLHDPGRSWHTDRGPVLRIMDWMSQVSAALGTMGTTLTGLTATGIDEVSLTGAGASSTMPQKRNPVRPSAMIALANQNAALRSGLAAAGMHQHQRDGGAWFTEWMLVPQIALATASALAHAIALAREMRPDTDRMRAALQDNFGLIHAEALSFALADRMPRPDAQAGTKDLCQEAMARQTSLADLARQRFPDLPDRLFQPQLQLGQAPEEANRFAKRVRAL